MTRYTDTIRRTAGIIRLEATGERDESDPYRHKWVTRLRFGLLSAEGPNTRGAVEYLEAELRALASCSEAIEALAQARARKMAETRAAEVKPVDRQQKFERDDRVEVFYLGHDIVTPDSGKPVGEAPAGVWLSGEYDAREGQRHSVWVHSLNGWVVVEDHRVRAVNRPSLADVG